ncbi:MAG: hypothetical protein ACJ748_01650 [Flavisolibacter sp.]
MVQAQYVQPMGYKDYSFWSQVNIGKQGAAATHPSAYLELGKATGSTKGLLFPRGNKDDITSPATGLVIYDLPSNKLKIFNGTIWIDVGLPAETDPFFTASPAYGITGTNISNWNTAFGWGNHAGLYPLMSGSYTNPSWISSLAWSKITSHPTTLSAYGITDAAPISGSANYIQNQNTSSQTANSWINGLTYISDSVLISNPNLAPDLHISKNRSGKVGITIAQRNPFGTGSIVFSNGSDGLIKSEISYNRATNILTVSGGNNNTGSVDLRLQPSFSGITEVYSPFLSDWLIRFNAVTKKTNLNGVINLVSLTSDPVSNNVNGDMYYNSTTNKVRKYVNGAWVDLVSTSDAILNQTGSQTGSFNITGTGTIGGGATIGGGGAGNTSINVGGSGVFSILESTVATLNSGASSAAGGLMTFERGTNVQGRSNIGYMNGNTFYSSQLGTVTGYTLGTLGFNSTGTQTLNTGQSFGASFVFDDQTAANNPNAIQLVYSASGSTITVPVKFEKDGTTVLQKLTQTQPTATTAAATTTIDLSTGNIFQINLAASITTLTLNNATPGKYYFQFTQDATGSRTVSWPASFKWPGGTAPTLTTTPNKTDYIECLYNGTNFLASAQINY